MAELKTAPTAASVRGFIDAVDDEERRRDCRKLMQILRRVTNARPKMWGPSIVGYGAYHYKYASGREGDWFVAGFSPRKRDLTIYVMAGFPRFTTLMKKLGKHKTGKSCLYVKRLDDIDLEVLEELLAASVKHIRATYPD